MPISHSTFIKIKKIKKRFQVPFASALQAVLAHAKRLRLAQAGWCNDADFSSVPSSPVSHMETGRGRRKLHTRRGHRHASQFHINASRRGNDVMYSNQMKTVNVCCMSNTHPRAHTYRVMLVFTMLLSPNALKSHSGAHL